MQELFICEKCKCIMTEKFGSGRFCSRKCANSRNHSETTKEKISKSLLERRDKNLGNLLFGQWSTELRKTRILEYINNPNHCKICNLELPYDKRNHKTCGNPECLHLYRSSIQKSRSKSQNIGKYVEGRHIVYKIINDFDDRYYIGVRKTELEFDGYLGSGIHICNMINKYGKEHFSRITLFEFDNSYDAFNKEKELLESALKDPLCVNLAPGGKGGATFKGKHHSEETKQKLREKRALQPNHKRSEEQKEAERARRYEANGGKWFSDDTLAKLRKSAERRRNPNKPVPFNKLSEEDKTYRKAEANRKRSKTLKGRSRSEETKQKLSLANKNKKASNKNKICINNGYKNKYITEAELDGYLLLGYVKGHIRNIGK